MLYLMAVVGVAGSSLAERSEQGGAIFLGGGYFASNSTVLFGVGPACGRVQKGLWCSLPFLP